MKPDSSRRSFMRPRRLLLAVDLLCAALAFTGAYFSLSLRGQESGQLRITLLNAGAILLIALALLLRSRQYSAPKRLAALSSIGVLVRDVVLAAAATTLLSYLTKGFFTDLTSPSRLTIGIAVAIFLGLGMIARVILSTYQRRQYSTGRGVRRILIAGEGVTAAELLTLIAERPQFGVSIAGILRLDIPDWPSPSEAGPHASDVDAVTANLTDDSLPILTISDDYKGLQELDDILRESQASEVVIALDPEDQAVLPRLAQLLSLAHVPVRVVPSLFEETYQVNELLGGTEIPVVDLGANPLDRVSRIAKRTMDLSISVAVLVLFSPLWLGISIAILASSGWPIVFTQERVGKNGRRFTLYKLRTMVRDAEARLAEVEAQNELASSEGRMFKLRGDPRITAVGSLLRKLSLDEIPQFFNVLMGDMSVVGPRPPLPREVARYDTGHLYRLRALPGITGLWQVSGRNDLDFEQMVGLDRYYVDHWSMRMDLSIILRTFGAVLTRRGAS